MKQVKNQRELNVMVSWKQTNMWGYPGEAGCTLYASCAASMNKSLNGFCAIKRRRSAKGRVQRRRKTHPL